MFQKIISLLYPRKCVNCSEIIKNGFLCPSCEEKYAREIAKGCRFCGMPFSLCTCEYEHFKNGRVIYALPYRRVGVSRAVLLKMKNSKKPEIIKNIASRMASALRDRGISGEMTVTYIPRSRVKVRLEGVDQSRELARGLAELKGFDLVSCLSCRVGGGEQKKLEHRERASHANARFSIISGSEDKVRGKRIVLVDDVITSGATMKACSDLLMGAGAKEVICLGAGRSVK